MASLDHVFLKIFREDQSEVTNDPVATEQTMTKPIVTKPIVSEPVASATMSRTMTNSTMTNGNDTVTFPLATAFDERLDESLDETDETMAATGENILPEIPIRGLEPGPSRRFRELYAQKNRNNDRETLQKDSLDSTMETSELTFPMRAVPTEEPSKAAAGEGTDSILKMYQEPMETAEKEEPSSRPADREFEYMAPIAGKLPTSCQRMLQKGATELGALADALHESRCAERRLIGFKGLEAGTGCSTLLLGAVGELVRRGLSILVIDGNFDNPVLASLLNIKVSFGWEESVFEKKPLETSLMKVSFPVEKLKKPGPLRSDAFFYFLPLARTSVSRAIVASCKRQWLDMVHEIAEGFDLVLVDMGRFEQNAYEEKVNEMLRFGLDGFYLVRDVRKSSDATLQACVDFATECDLPCLGIVENFV